MSSDFSKYPRLKRFLADHPKMSVDDVLKWTEAEMILQEKKDHEYNDGADLSQ